MRFVLRVVNVPVFVVLAALIVMWSGHPSAARGQRAGGAQPAGPRGKSSPFVGTWILNVSKSTYEGIPPEQRRNPSIRTIDVEGDGTFVETHRNKTGGGREGFYHWKGKPGVADIVEYARTGGDAPGNKLTVKVVSDHQWQVTFTTQQGQAIFHDSWTVSPDNKTLTIDRRSVPPSAPTHSVEVFDNEGWAMPRAAP